MNNRIARATRGLWVFKDRLIVEWSHVTVQKRKRVVALSLGEGGQAEDGGERVVIESNEQRDEGCEQQQQQG